MFLNMVADMENSKTLKSFDGNDHEQIRQEISL